MAECIRGNECIFHLTVEPSIVKRIRHAGSFPYCRGGRQEECALYVLLERGEEIPANLLPDGSTGDYLEDAGAGSGSSAGASGATGAAAIGAHRFMVVDDSMVFATIAANTIRQNYPRAEVVQCHSYEEAASAIRANHFHVIVSGNGLGGGRTVHDVRKLSFAPIVLFTGRPLSKADLPANSCMVMKAAGPGALCAAVGSMLEA